MLHSNKAIIRQKTAQWEKTALKKSKMDKNEIFKIALFASWQKSDSKKIVHFAGVLPVREKHLTFFRLFLTDQIILLEFYLSSKKTSEKH